MCSPPSPYCRTHYPFRLLFCSCSCAFACPCVRVCVCQYATHVGAKSSDNFAIIAVISKSRKVRLSACVCVCPCVCPCVCVCVSAYHSHYPAYSLLLLLRHKNIYLAVDKLPCSTQLIQQMRNASPSWRCIRIRICIGIGICICTCI